MIEQYCSWSTEFTPLSASTGSGIRTRAELSASSDPLRGSGVRLSPAAVVASGEQERFSGTPFADSSSRDSVEENTGDAEGQTFEEEEEDRTVEEWARETAVACLTQASSVGILSPDMIEDLRRRLRSAEEREHFLVGTGARGGEGEGASPNVVSGELQSPPETDFEPSVIVADQTEIEPNLESEVLANLEVSLAPCSESNLYGGFDSRLPGGVFCATYQSVKTGAFLRLKLYLPGGCVLETLGRVSWLRSSDATTGSQSPGIGVQFVSLGPDQRGLVSAFAAKREPLFYPG